MFKNYSTGMRQKLSIALGLLTNPDIIFMDEPTKSLDVQAVQKLRNLIREKLVGEEKKQLYLQLIIYKKSKKYVTVLP